MRGEKAYTKFSQPMNDTIYKRGFCAWERFNKKLLSMNQMFYYIGFGNGMTADLRLALFAEIFEPLSEHLEYLQKFKLIVHSSLGRETLGVLNVILSSKSQHKIDQV